MDILRVFVYLARAPLLNPELGDVLLELGMDDPILANKGGDSRAQSYLDERSFSEAVLSRALLGLARQNTVNVMSANSWGRILPFIVRRQV